MKNILLIVGIVIIVVGALALLFALLNMLGYYNLHDGTAEHYYKLQQRAIICFVIGIVLAVIGAICIILRFKL